jgi:UDP-N-acetylglucosamine diphosphorylase / glucose-1-phosphate thymidylyltransferase / UDP-N-acetylgalactosamine diphosphorylase / glucosamine-1-phosphate N-acetyltransferase / galactosamine-1-phosphate N-acetyltransferase
MGDAESPARVLGDVVTQVAPATQAVILARGLGTRMRRDAGSSAQLSAAQQQAAASGAKGMMPLGSRPFLDYVLSALADAGITDATLVIGPEHVAVREYYSSIAAPKRVAVHFAVQAEPKGTADAVHSARGVVRDAPFLTLNSDNYYPVAAYRELSAIGGAGLVAFEADALVRDGGIEAERVLKYALLDIDDDGFLREIREKPAADDPLARRAERWVSMNLWSFTPAIFEACARIHPSTRGELEIQDAVMLAIRELGERFRVLPMRAGVLDLSSRADVAFVASRLEHVSPDP